MPDALARGLRRARAQAALLAAVLALLLLATTLCGTAARLLTTGQDAALAASLAGADPRESTAVARFELDAGGGGARAGEQQEVLNDAAGALRATTAPAPARTWTAWSTSARYTTGAGSPSRTATRADLSTGRLAYLGSVEGSGGGLADHARLAAGRWPGAPAAGGTTALEVVAPASAVEGAGLGLGAEVLLEAAPGEQPVPPPVLVRVVGTYEPLTSDPVWQLDPLRGAGSTAVLDVPGTTGRVQLPGTGPLLLEPSVLASGATSSGWVTAARGGAVVVPDLAGLSPQVARALVAPRESSLVAVREAVAGRADAVAVTARLPALLERSGEQLAGAGAGLLAACAVVAAAALASVAAASQLLRERRRGDDAVLALRGASGRQRTGQDAVEVGVLAALAAVAAPPASSAVAQLLLAASLGTGSSSPGSVPGPVLAAPGWPVLAAVASAAAAGVVVVLVPHLLRADPALVGGARRSAARSAPVRSGADLLLLAVVAAAWWQLRGGGGGVLLAVAPALAVLAGALLGLRALSLVRRPAERVVRRADGALTAVGGWTLARRPLAAAAAALVVLSAAGATTAVTWRGAWAGAADQRVAEELGADVVVGRDTGEAGDAATGTAVLQRTAALAAASGADPAPVISAAVALGTRAGAGPVRLVGAPAGLVPPSVLPRSQQARLRSGDALIGPALPAGTGPLRVTVSGTSDADGPLAGRLELPRLRGALTLVLRDARGALGEADGAPVPLDGAAHVVELDVPDRSDPTGPERTEVVGLRLRLLPAVDDGARGGEDDAAASVEQRADVEVRLPEGGLPGTGRSGAWSAAVDVAGVLGSPVAALEGPVLRASALVVPAALPVVGGVVSAQSSPPPEQLPVLLSAQLAADVGARPGQRLALGVGAVQVPASVVGVVDDVPGSPGRAAVLADGEALSRALLAQGVLPPVQRWWLGGLRSDERAGAASAVEAAGLGPVQVRSGVARAARHDPLAAGLRAGWLVLIAGSGAAALAGSVLLVAAAAGEDAAAAARLHVLGVPRRPRAVAVLAPRAVQLALALVLGTAAGVVVALTVVPLLVGTPVELGRLAAQLPWPAVVLALVVLAVLVAVPQLVAGVQLVRPAPAAPARPPEVAA